MIERTFIVAIAAVILACTAAPAGARVPNGNAQGSADKGARKPSVGLRKMQKVQTLGTTLIHPNKQPDKQPHGSSHGVIVTTRAVQAKPAADYSFLKELGWGKPLVRQTTVLTGDPRLGLAARKIVTKTRALSWQQKASVLRMVRAKFDQLEPGQIQALQEIAVNPGEHLGTRQAAQELLAKPPQPGSVDNLMAKFRWPGPRASWYEKVEFLTRVHQGGKTLSVSQLELIDSLSRSRNPFVKRSAKAILKDPPHPGSWRSLYGRYYSPLSGPLEWHRMTDFLARVYKSDLRLSKEQLAHIRRLTRSKEPYVAAYARRIIHKQSNKK